MVERGEEETGEDGGSVARVSRARDPAPPRVRSPRLRVVHPRAPVVAAARRDGEGTRHQTGDSSLLTDLHCAECGGRVRRIAPRGSRQFRGRARHRRSHPSAGHGPTEDPRRRPSRPTGKSATDTDTDTDTIITTTTTTTTSPRTTTASPSRSPAVPRATRRPPNKNSPSSASSTAGTSIPTHPKPGHPRLLPPRGFRFRWAPRRSCPTPPTTGTTRTARGSTSTRTV